MIRLFKQIFPVIRLKLMFTDGLIEYNCFGFNEIQEELMNKLLKGILAALMVTSLAACSSEKKEEATTGGSLVTIQVNTEGMGIIAVNSEGKEPEIDKENMLTQIVTHVAEGATLGMNAEGREGWKFSKWTKDGEDFSKDALITVTADADAEYVAVFVVDSGWDGEPVSDISDAKVLSDVFGAEPMGSIAFEERYIWAFVLNGTHYRAVADIDPDLAHQIWDLDYEDPDHNKKEMDLLKDIEIKTIENLDEMIAGEDEIAQFAGKTGADLVDAGFTFDTFYADEHYFEGNYGVGYYRVFYEGKPDTSLDDLNEMISPLTIVSIDYQGIGDFAAGLE